MSKSLAICFGDRFFWVYDTVHDVFLKFLIDAASAHGSTDPAWLANEIESWRVVACVGDISIDLDERWTSSQRQEFCILVEQACTALLDRDWIRMDEIREWPIHPEFRISPREDVPAKSLIRFGYGLIQLMSGTLPGEPDGTAWFFGTGEQLEVIKMRLS